MTVSPIPQGFSSLTPTLVVDGAAEAIKLYQKAFDARLEYSMPSPDGKKIAHACMQLGNSKLFLCDVMPESGCATPTISGFYVYVDNVDATFAQAQKAGLIEKSPLQDMFWGDRVGSFTDKFGIMWTVASHVRDVSDEEIKAAAKNMGSKAA